MRTRSLLCWLGFASLLAVIALVAVLMLAPWRPFVEQKIVAALAQQGITQAHLTIDHVGWQGLTLADISLGDDPPLTLARATIGWQLRALLGGRVEAITLSGLNITLAEGSSGWGLAVLEALSARQAPAAPTPIAIPLTQAALARLPLSELRLEEATLRVTGAAVQATLPFTLTGQSGPPARLELKSGATSIGMGKNTLTLGGITLALTLDEAGGQWRGDWQIRDITSPAHAAMIPPLHARGTLTLDADTLLLTGNLSSVDESHRARFTLRHRLHDPTATTLALSKAQLPWNGGTIRLTDTSIALNGTAPIALVLTLADVPVDALLKTLTSERGTATGTVSGTLPMSITRDGRVRIGNSSLRANGPGVITLAPDLIPGDNPQVGLVRDVLKNLHYSVLDLGLTMADGKNLAVLLKVEGNNPDVERGRAVKLQVQLSGDLLDLITQNLTLIQDPESLLQQPR